MQKYSAKQIKYRRGNQFHINLGKHTLELYTPIYISQTLMKMLQNV